MLTDEQIMRFRELAQKPGLLDADVRQYAETLRNACELIGCIPSLLAEIERLSAQRPSCATCKFSAPSHFDRILFCWASDSYVGPEYTDGVCLWEAKCPA